MSVRFVLEQIACQTGTLRSAGEKTSARTSGCVKPVQRITNNLRTDTRNRLRCRRDGVTNRRKPFRRSSAHTLVSRVAAQHMRIREMRPRSQSVNSRLTIPLPDPVSGILQIHEAAVRQRVPSDNDSRPRSRQGLPARREVRQRCRRRSRRVWHEHPRALSGAGVRTQEETETMGP